MVSVEMIEIMRGSRKFCQRGSQLDIFLADERREDRNASISGPSLAHKRNNISMVFRWCDDDGPTLNAGLLAL